MSPLVSRTGQERLEHLAVAPAWLPGSELADAWPSFVAEPTAMGVYEQMESDFQSRM